MKKIGIILMICMAVFFQYCSSSKKAVVKPVILTYVTNVEPTVLANCSPCHIPPRGNKLALNSYDAVKTNIGDIIIRISKNPNERGFMPFKHEKLSDSVIHIFVKWQADGLLQN